MTAQFFGITDIWTYVLGAVVVILLPGPNTMYVLSLAAQRGVRAGYRAACGVFLGDAILMILSASGVASLLKTNPVLFSAVKYGGGAYLFYLGIGMLRGAWRTFRQPVEAGVAKAMRETDVGRPFGKALTVSLLNPKGILFFIAFFIQFVDRSYSYPALSFFILGVIAQCISFFYLSTLIFTGSRLAQHFRQHRKLTAGAASGIAGLFIGFSVKLTMATMG